MKIPLRLPKSQFILLPTLQIPLSDSGGALRIVLIHKTFI
jgi:hypothetical protein